METSTFRRFCAIAYEKAGITLGDSKEALVEARVGKRMRAVRQKVISGMERLLRPGGYLPIGHAEALSGVRTGL